MFVLASHNPNKTAVLRQALTRAGLRSCLASDLSLPEPEETGDRLMDNAKLKALAAAKATNMIAIADDSGLFVPVLDGGPGVKTADWSESSRGRNWDLAMRRIHDSVLERGAKFPVMGAFVATLVVAHPDGRWQVFTGEQAGHVIWPPRGTGFALDPIFQPFGANAPLSMLDPMEYAAFNHRARVATLVAEWLSSDEGQQWTNLSSTDALQEA